MAALTCDICGGNLSMDASGDFAVCESCGMRHTKDRVKAKIQGIGGSSAKPVQIVTSNVPKIIPKRFTDRFINDEITGLLKSIKKCQLDIESLGRAIDNNADQERRLRNDIQRQWDTISRVNRQHGFAESFHTDADMIMINTYNEQLNDAVTRKYKAQVSIKEESEKKAEYEIKQRELEVLLQKTEVQRAEEHYQSLLAEKRTANNIDKLTALEKKFREMEGYADTEELARECGNLAKQTQEREERELREVNERRLARHKEEKYQKLLKNKNKASTEQEFQSLAGQFRAMDGYKDTSELAKDCYNRYNECKEQRIEVEYNNLVEAKNKASTEQEFQALAGAFRAMNGYKDTSELASECDNRYRELKEQRVEVEYNELAESMVSASTELEYQDITRQFLAMGSYKNAVALADECDKRYRELKEQREERERAERKRREDENRAIKELKEKEMAKLEEKQERQAKREQLFGVIFKFASGGIVGGLVFAFLAKVVGFGTEAFWNDGNIWGFAFVTGLIACIAFFVWSLRYNYDEIGGACGWGCGGCLGGFIGGLIVAVILGFLLGIMPFAAYIVIGVVAGAVAGHFIDKKING